MAIGQLALGKIQDHTRPLMIDFMNHAHQGIGSFSSPSSSSKNKSFMCIRKEQRSNEAPKFDLLVVTRSQCAVLVSKVCL